MLAWPGRAGSGIASCSNRGRRSRPSKSPSRRSATGRSPDGPPARPRPGRRRRRGEFPDARLVGLDFPVAAPRVAVDAEGRHADPVQVSGLVPCRRASRPSEPWSSMTAGERAPETGNWSLPVRTTASAPAVSLCRNWSSERSSEGIVTTSSRGGRPAPLHQRRKRKMTMPGRKRWV